MGVILLDRTVPDWVYIRQALSLALLKNRPITIAEGMAFLNAYPEYFPVLDDISRALTDRGAGKLVSEGNDLIFHPRPLLPGRMSLRSGPLSSAVEILLLFMPALFRANFRSVIEIDGVSHSPLSYPTLFIKESFLGLLEMLGFYGSLTLRRFGFHGSGGGFLESRIYPGECKDGIGIPSVAPMSFLGITIVIARMSTELAELEKSILSSELDIHPDRISIIEVMDCDGPGNSVQLLVKWKDAKLVLTREIQLFNEEGGPYLTEDTMRQEMVNLSDEAKELFRKKQIPESLLRELIPYLEISGLKIRHSGEGVTTDFTRDLCKILL